MMVAKDGSGKEGTVPLLVGWGAPLLITDGAAETLVP